MFSPRYAIPTALLLVIALIPTVIHNYFGLTLDDGRNTAGIGIRLAGFDSRPTDRNSGWGEATFDCYDWFERTYRDEKGHTVRLFVCRSFNHKKLYHHPELALSYGKDMTRAETVSFKLPPVIDVSLLRSTSDKGMASYALLYEDQFISTPILHQIKNSLQLLVSPRKPLTLFYVSDDEVDSHSSFDNTRMALILSRAIAQFIATNQNDTNE